MIHRKVLVVGGFGFLGSNLVRMWSEEWPFDKITVMDYLGMTSDGRNLIGLDGKYNHLFVDIRDPKAVMAAMEQLNPDCVINCGTSFHFENIPPINRDYYETDVLGTLNLLEACQSVWPKRSRKRFLQVSTDEIFGTLKDDEEPFDESDSPNPKTAYAMAKAAADQVALAHYIEHGIDVVVTHGATTYGPNQSVNFLIPYLIRSACEGKPMQVPDASTIRDWIYVDDHCWGIMQCFELGQSGTSYCLSGNAERSNGDVAEMTGAIFERLMDRMSAADIRPIRIPDIQLSDQIRPDRRVITSYRAMAEFGWEPEHHLEMALESTILWYVHRFLGVSAFH